MVLSAQLGRVRAEQLMAVQPAAEQLIAQLRAVTAWPFRPRRGHVDGRRSAGFLHILSPVSPSQNLKAGKHRDR